MFWWSRAGPSVWVFSTLLLALVWAGGSLAQDEPGGWDAELVTKRAVELEAIFRETYELSLSPPPQQTALQQRQRDAAQGEIRRVRDLAADYAGRMRSGWSRADSEPYVRLLVEGVNELWSTAGDAVPQAKAKALLDRANEIMNELQAHYAPS
jgi:hypothetical protein